jgi:hypothetical protein
MHDNQTQFLDPSKQFSLQDNTALANEASGMHWLTLVRA